MKKLSGYLVLLFLSAGTGRLYAQSTDAIQQKLADAVANYYKKYPQEKLFVHTDQTAYLSGQTLWYKVYAMAYGKPSQLSKIAYVRLTNGTGKQVLQDKIPVKNSTAYGNFNLPDSLQTGFYQLTAYTSWMLNFGNDGLFTQTIYIQNNRGTAIATASTTTAKQYHIDFYPEGGDLVDGNICNIAFKAIDQNGMPAKVYGNVLDNSRAEKAKLATLHDGMGSFELEANANSTYIAQVHFPDNTIRDVALPKVHKTGIIMRVNSVAADEFEIRIINAGQQQEFKDIVLMAVQNNGQNAAYPLKLSRGINVIGVKKSDFATGILRLSVFDEKGIPLAERIVFVDNNDKLNLSLATDTLSYEPKGTNVFTLNVKGAAKANFSVAVTDAQADAQPEDNISSYFLMSAELRGRINQPSWYFKNNSDTLKQQLDLVMLTNGWRHFKWDTLLNVQSRALKYAVAGPQVIAGKIEGFKSSSHLKIKYLISNNDSGKYTGLIIPDTAGRFMLTDYDGKGAANLYFRVVDEKNRRQPLKVALIAPPADTAFLPADTLLSNTTSLSATNAAFLTNLAALQQTNFTTNGIKLKTVDVKARKLSPTEQLIESHVKHFSVDNAPTLNLVGMDVSTSSILDYIQGRFPGLNVFLTADGNVTFNYRGAHSLPLIPAAPSSPYAFLKNQQALASAPSGRESGEPYYYVDESSASLDDIKTIPLTDVALIRFVPPPAYFAPLNGGVSGALLIYTKRFGDEKIMGKNSEKNFDEYTFNGYSVTREYASPDYSIAAKTAAADYRTTLLWEHDLTPDSKGNINLHFYNSDKAKHYRVVVQGMDSEGRLGYFNQEF